MTLDNVQIRLGYRMLCHKDRTAVLIRQDRGFICADLLGNIHDLHLIKADQRAEHRKRTYFIRYRKRLYRLGCHLSDTLSGDQSETFILLRDLLGDHHHITAHDDRKLLMRTFFINIKLDIRKIDGMQIDRSCITGYLSCQIHNLLLRTVRGIRRCMEVHRINLNATLGDHITGNRRIDTA